MKPNLTSLEGNLTACNRADDLYVRMKESGEDKNCHHDWEWINDWYGDPEVISGTADCSHWRCTICGKEDYNEIPTQACAPLEPPTKTEIHCREHKRERFEKMLERVYGFFRRKI